MNAECDHVDEAAPRVLNPPDEIYLVYGPLDGEDQEHATCDEVVWDTKAHDSSDVRYIREGNGVMTCAFCGQTYPPGTPAARQPILTAHIRGCPQHPMRELEVECAELRTALAELAGFEGEDEAFVAATERAFAVLRKFPARMGPKGEAGT